MTVEFKPWPKIKRIENKRSAIFTEKLDGTNACVVITPYNKDTDDLQEVYIDNGYTLRCQSRNKFITPRDDNYGFARWAYDKGSLLIAGLGEGYHYGEWWGLGVGRGYNLPEKRFSLFNTLRWGSHNPNTPACVSVVPILPISSVDQARSFLSENGSVAAPGYTRPEGAVMYEPDTDTCFKIIIDK